MLNCDRRKDKSEAHRRGDVSLSPSEATKREKSPCFPSHYSTFVTEENTHTKEHERYRFKRSQMNGVVVFFFTSSGSYNMTWGEEEGKEGKKVQDHKLTTKQQKQSSGALQEHCNDDSITAGPWLSSKFPILGFSWHLGQVSPTAGPRTSTMPQDIWYLAVRRKKYTSLFFFFLLKWEMGLKWCCVLWKGFVDANKSFEWTDWMWWFHWCLSQLSWAQPRPANCKAAVSRESADETAWSMGGWLSQKFGVYLSLVAQW